MRYTLTISQDDNHEWIFHDQKLRKEEKRKNAKVVEIKDDEGEDEKKDDIDVDAVEQSKEGTKRTILLERINVH